MPAGFHLCQRKFSWLIFTQTKSRRAEAPQTSESAFSSTFSLTQQTVQSLLCTGQDARFYWEWGVKVAVSRRTGRLVTCMETTQLLCCLPWSGSSLVQACVGNQRAQCPQGPKPKDWVGGEFKEVSYKPLNISHSKQAPSSPDFRHSLLMMAVSEQTAVSRVLPGQVHCPQPHLCRYISYPDISGNCWVNG